MENLKFRMEKTTPSGSHLHRGRTRYIITLKRFLAFVSPPVQGGVRGGSWKRPPRAAGI